MRNNKKNAATGIRLPSVAEITVDHIIELC
jgi:hypothetical protein